MIFAPGSFVPLWAALLAHLVVGFGAYGIVHYTTSPVAVFVGDDDGRTGGEGRAPAVSVRGPAWVDTAGRSLDAVKRSEERASQEETWDFSNR